MYIHLNNQIPLIQKTKIVLVLTLKRILPPTVQSNNSQNNVLDQNSKERNIDKRMGRGKTIISALKHRIYSTMIKVMNRGNRKLA